MAVQLQSLLKGTNAIQNSALTPTDLKASTLVRNFLSQAFVGTSILSSSTFIFLAIVINPLWALGIVPAIVLGTIGIKLATQIIEQKKQPKPIGLINPGLDCWINSTFQLLANISAFQIAAEKNVQGKLMNPLYEALRRYQKEQLEGKDPISSVSSREIGQWIYDAARIKNKKKEYLPDEMQPITSNDGSKQEEAGEFMKFFLEKCKGPLPIREKTIIYEKKHPEKREESIKPKSDTDTLIILHPVETRSFRELWKDYFRYIAPHSDPNKENLLTKYFSAAPADFTLELKRFAAAGWDAARRVAIAPRKITDAIDVPLDLVLTNEQCPSEPFTAYECDGVIAHHSTSIDHGHYVSYVKVGDQWWYMSDTLVKAVSEKEVMKEVRSKGCIFHFSKKKQIGGSAV